ncbi:pirin family protein [Paucibacter sp. R3-3]|uniref:Pirin family protein n=1 Tax=Roseateles agri TaxID=3098619 RepID=A0ABU5DDF4_9BURK|nr:pirin family protein [Paucibacter sp. R3-3]MDY0744307.1 pirin family protein [Paucibacter sp. R3-3]
MNASNPLPIVGIQPLGFPWPTLDPFLFCVYHDDAYPAGNGAFGPQASLAGRQIGQDFAGKDGWRMYHGKTVPGFPAHPHRGFETVTVVRKGRIDHADSMGATARYGDGDTQWLTTGSGIVHAEMFPLLDEQAPNPLELFQIWLNLPARSKMAAPHFTMFWAEQIPRHLDSGVEIACIAGRIGDATQGLTPPPDSWASQAEADLAIWTLKLQPGAAWTLPAAAGGNSTRRQLYFFKGKGLQLAGQVIGSHVAIELRGDAAVPLVNGGSDVIELLMLQGRPIGEPVAQYGPFVMNTEQELRQTFDDYRRTGFGGWPWPDEAPVHGADPERFARHADGRVERAGKRA